MVKLISITESDKPEKKLVAKFQTDSGRTKSVHFGQRSAPDFTLSHDKEQRERYRTRHAKNENWNDPTTAGALSRFILWGDSTSRATNIAAYRKKFNL